MNFALSADVQRRRKNAWAALARKQQYEQREREVTALEQIAQALAVKETGS